MSNKKRKQKKRRPGAGKGASFERKICKALSLWVSGGKRTDIFWRTAMSGGRATFHRRQGVDIRQTGDICSVSPEGRILTDKWVIECKHHRTLEFTSFLFSGHTERPGRLTRFWEAVQKEAEACGRKPMLIACQNFFPILVITHIGALEEYTSPQLTSDARQCHISLFSDMILYKFPAERRRLTVAGRSWPAGTWSDE